MTSAYLPQPMPRWPSLLDFYKTYHGAPPVFLKRYAAENRNNVAKVARHRDRVAKVMD